MRQFTIAALTAAVLVAGVSASSARQDGVHDRQAGHEAATATTERPYADRFEAAAAIRSLTPQEIGQIERGEGAGFALPAELNGVPGPRHVLDFAADLDLTEEQEKRVQAVFDAMRAEAVTAGERYLDAVLALEDGFREGALAEDDVTDRIADVQRLEGELAAAHLVAHLETAALLTPEQIAEYGRLRGYE